MATKYQFITGVYESTINKVTDAPAAWTAFLRSACRNYKCRFDEQILIYAQRPDATAVLEFDKWNKQFNRRINRGATGIAVFDDEHNGNTRLKHYIDISDTHESEFARPVPLWSMKPEYEAEVIESLENSFGELDDIATMADAIVSANRADGNEPNGAFDLTDGGNARRDGADESRESDAMDRDDEQHPSERGGNGTERPDIQLTPLPPAARQLNMFAEAEESVNTETSAFSISQQIIDEELTSGGNEQDSTLRIAAYFKKDHTTADNAAFLQREYHTGGKGFIFGGNHVSVWFDESGIRVNGSLKMHKKVGQIMYRSGVRDLPFQTGYC